MTSLSAVEKLGVLPACIGLQLLTYQKVEGSKMVRLFATALIFLSEVS